MRRGLSLGATESQRLRYSLTQRYTVCMDDVPLSMPFALVVSTNVGATHHWKTRLAEAGIKSHVLNDINSAAAIASEWHFDAIIISGMKDSGEFASLFKDPAVGKIPKIFVSEACGESSVVAALEAGASCVMQEPVSARHLSIQLQRLLALGYRRLVGPPQPIDFGPILLEPTRMNAYIHDVALELTRTEFEILKMLVLCGGEIVARESIIRALPYSTFAKGARSCDMHVCRIRKKLLKLAGNVVNIKTVRGRGYQLCASAFGKDENIRSQ